MSKKEPKLITYYKHKGIGFFIKVIFLEKRIFPEGKRHYGETAQEFLVLKNAKKSPSGNSHSYRRRAIISSSHKDFENILKESKRLFQKRR